MNFNRNSVDGLRLLKYYQLSFFSRQGLYERVNIDFYHDRCPLIVMKISIHQQIYLSLVSLAELLVWQNFRFGCFWVPVFHVSTISCVTLDLMNFTDPQTTADKVVPDNWLVSVPGPVWSGII